MSCLFICLLIFVPYAEWGNLIERFIVPVCDHTDTSATRRDGTRRGGQDKKKQRRYASLEPFRWIRRSSLERERERRFLWWTFLLAAIGRQPRGSGQTAHESDTRGSDERDTQTHTMTNDSRQFICFGYERNELRIERDKPDSQSFISWP